MRRSSATSRDETSMASNRPSATRQRRLPACPRGGRRKEVAGNAGCWMDVARRWRESTEIVVGEVRDVDRVAAAVVVVGGGGEEGRAQSSVESSGLRTHRALHLVEHDALDCELGRGIVHLREPPGRHLSQETSRGVWGGRRRGTPRGRCSWSVHGRGQTARVVGGGRAPGAASEGTRGCWKGSRIGYFSLPHSAVCSRCERRQWSPRVWCGTRR